MSICNVYVDADVALVVVDTAALMTNPDGSTVSLEAQKAMIHGDVLVATRGGMGIPSALHSLFLLHAKRWHTDEALKELPAMLDRAYQEQRCVFAEAGIDMPDSARTSEIVVVGWSKRLQRIKAVVATLEGSEWTIEEITATSVAPAVEGVTRDEVAIIPGMQALAARQVAAFKAADPQAPIGGELTLYRVDREGFLVKKLGAV